MAFDKTKPTDSGLLINAPGQIRANWDALETGTTASLLVTNAKVASNADITEGKLLFTGTGHGHTGGAGGKAIDLATAITGTLPIANGGTAIGSYTHGDILYVNTSGNLVKLTAGTANKLLSTNGAGADPSWSFQVLDSDTMSGASATTLATSESIKAYVDTASSISSTEITKVVGDDVIVATTTDYAPNTTGTGTNNYYKAFTITIGAYNSFYGGAYRFKFEHTYGQTNTPLGSGESPTPYVASQIYLNGSPYGAVIEGTHTPNPSWESESEDLSGLSDGDVVDLYTSIQGNSLTRGGIVRNFSINHTDPNTDTAITYEK